MDTIFKINELIKRKISGEITAEEETTLQQWASQSEKNRARLERYLNADFLTDINGSQTIPNDTTLAWSKLNRRLSKERTRRVYGKRMLQIAAVLVPLAVILTIITAKQDPQNATIASVEQGAEVKKEGFSQTKLTRKTALLMLADGSTVELKAEDKMIQVNDQEILVNDKPVARNNQTSSEAVTYSIFSIPRGAGEYCITLSDGTKVWLNADSEITFPNQFVGDKRVVSVKGELFFDVAKDSGRKFIVKTSEYDVEVLGTRFNVRDYANESYSQTTLVSGKVVIQMNKKSIEMIPGDMCSLAGGEMKIEKVDTNESISWTTGVMQFRDKSFAYIMESVARWYDLKITFENRTLENLIFSGSFKRYDDLNVILNMLRDAGNVKIIQSGREVIIRN